MGLVRSQIAAVRWTPMQLHIMLLCAWSRFIWVYTKVRAVPGHPCC